QDEETRQNARHRHADEGGQDDDHVLHGIGWDDEGRARDDRVEYGPIRLRVRAVRTPDDEDELVEFWVREDGHHPEGANRREVRLEYRRSSAGGRPHLGAPDRDIIAVRGPEVCNRAAGGAEKEGVRGLDNLRA